jgi:hypothetical protein
MTQSTSYQVPAHPSGLDMRTQLNIIVLAILGDNAGPVEPAELYPGMMWGDTTAMRLKRRNNTNDAWIDIGPLDDFLGDIRTQLDDASDALGAKVDRTGDKMTGRLTIQGADIAFQGASADTPLGFISSDVNAKIMGFINAAGNAWNLSISDAGVVTSRAKMVMAGGTSNGRFSVVGGELNLSGVANMYLRYSGVSAQMEWVNNAYSAVIGSMDDGGNFGVNGVVRSGPAVLDTSGNLYMPWAGAYLSTVLGQRANAGAQVRHAVGPTDFGAISSMGGIIGNPWLVAGLTGPGNGTANAIRVYGVWCVNQ